MERRIYFLAGDALSNAVMGMASAWLAMVIVDPGWQMFVAMLAGMAAGMGLALVLMPVFVALFGAMEVMLPVMLSAMLAGMVSSMAAAMHVPSVPEALLGGASIGILVLLSSYVADAGMNRKRR